MRISSGRVCKGRGTSGSELNTLAPWHSAHKVVTWETWGAIRGEGEGFGLEKRVDERVHESR